MGRVVPDRAAPRRVPRARNRRLRRRAVTLLAMTAVLPGSAQYVAGHRGLGRAVLRLVLGLLVVAGLGALVAWANLGVAVGIVSRSWVLTGVRWFLVGLAIGWMALFVDAWRLSRPDGMATSTRRRVAAATAVLALVVPGTLVYASAGVAAGRDALSAMFVPGPVADSTDGRFNILLLGGDSGANREGTRPDSIQLASIDEDTGRAVLFGFARDTENITFREGSVMSALMPQGWTCGDECLLNALYTWGQDHADEFPDDVADPGLLATREAVEAISGLDVHYYVLVDLEGFRDLVDAVGGLDINVMYDTPIGGGASKVRGYIEAGEQHLDGYHALWYARSREGSSNYQRMARQRCVMTAMVNQLDPVTLALRVRQIADASGGVIQTDLPASQLGAFANLALKTRSQKIMGVNFVPPLIKPWDYDRDEVRRIVADTIDASESADHESVAGVPTTPHPSGSASTGAADGDQTPATAPRQKVKVSATPLNGTGPDRPSEDADADTDDITAVCSVVD